MEIFIAIGIEKKTKNSLLLIRTKNINQMKNKKIYTHTGPWNRVTEKYIIKRIFEIKDFNSYFME